MMKKLKPIGLMLLLTLLVLPLSAQERSDTSYLFRFVPGRDLFYVPYKGNGAELDRLLGVLEENMERLRAGQMYILVSSYAAKGNDETDAQRMGYLHNSRVKSELITRGGVTEQMFLTDRMIAKPYGDSLHNVVVVVFPAGVEKVEQIAGEKAAAKVEAYIAEVAANSPTARAAAEARSAAEKAAREAAEREAAARRAQEERVAAQAQQEAEAKRAEAERLAAEELARLQIEATAKPYTLALRANLLRWATLTPDLGVEWRITGDWSILVDGTWTSWSWSDKSRRYALWEVSPAIHYYIGKEKRGYVGAMYHIGEFNYKLSHTGKQGDLQGGGIVGGYRLPIGKCLMLDFNLGVGYTRADYEKYTVTDGVRVRQGNDVKNYWGINQAGITLVWKLF